MSIKPHLLFQLRTDTRHRNHETQSSGDLPTAQMRENPSPNRHPWRAPRSAGPPLKGAWLVWHATAAWGSAALGHLPIHAFGGNCLNGLLSYHLSTHIYICSCIARDKATC